MTVYPSHATWAPPQDLTSRDDRTARRKKRAGANFRINKALVAAETPEDILVQVAGSIRYFNFVNLSTALYRLALIAQPLTALHKAHVRADPRLLALLQELTDTIGIDAEAEPGHELVLPPKELSNVVWAATKLGINDAALFEQVKLHVVRHVGSFDSVNLSLTLWGLAKMDVKAADVFRVAQLRVEQLLPEFEPHRICNTVWAFAKAGFATEKFFLTIADECTRKLSKFNHSNESMILYAYALGGVHAPLLFQRMMAKQTPVIRSREVADPRSLSNLLWALAELQLQHTYGETIDAIGQSAVENIHRYSLTHMATLCCAFAKSGVRNDVLFDLIARECETRDGVNDPACFADLVKLKESLAVFGFKSDLVTVQVDKMVTLANVESAATVVKQEESKWMKIAWDLLGTTLVAICVIIVASLVKRYFAIKA
jgi:hypothetical protein